MLRNEYLKEHKSGTYTYFLLTARLDSYLADLNEQAQERFELIEAQMRSAEELRNWRDRILWNGYATGNNIRNRVAEIIKQELIYGKGIPDMRRELIESYYEEYQRNWKDFLNPIQRRFLWKQKFIIT